MLPGELRSFLPGFIDLTYVRNIGAAFGLFPGRQPVFIAVSLVVLVVIAGYWRRARPNLAIIIVALALITAGAVGNLIDRAVIGRVTDFLSFAFVDFPVFNVADAAIVTGTAILIVWLLFAPEPQRPGVEVKASEAPESAPPPETASALDDDAVTEGRG